MPKYTVLVDTIEHHTRRYTVEADDEDDARDQIEDGCASLNYIDTYEGLAKADESPFLILEVWEEEYEQR